MAINKTFRTQGTAYITCLGIVSYCFWIPASAEALKSRSYKKNKESMGVVLLDANWGRAWGCGGNDNAQLVSFGFDRIDDGEATPSDRYTSVLVKSRSRLFVDSAFKNYGFLVQPGTFALTAATIKVAKTKSDVFNLVANKEKFVSSGEYLGGTFRVDAGEVVYIGNFWLDCLESPVIWRYYTEGAENFANHVAEYKQTFKFLRNSHVVYRLFDTVNFGHEYELSTVEKDDQGSAFDSQPQ